MNTANSSHVAGVGEEWGPRHLRGRSFRVGAIEVQVFCDACVPAPLADDVKEEPEEGWQFFRQRYPSAFADGDELLWRFHIHAYLLAVGERLVMVDTGLGGEPQFEIWNRWAGPRPEKVRVDWIARLSSELKEAGVQVEDVDDVVVSHLHLDHAGGMFADGELGTQLAFPNARYHVPREDYVFYESQTREPLEAEIFERFFRHLGGIAEVSITQDEEVIADGVQLLNTPGHSRGHRSVLLRSRGESAVLACDVLHHPFQLAHMEYRGQDDLGDAGVATRERLVQLIKEDGSLLSATHFVEPFGRLRSEHGKQLLDVVA